MPWLDHLVMSATSLAQGEAHLAQGLNLPLAIGGEHAAMSTHNRLLSLGAVEYFELIAINPDAPPPERRRWFALDRFDGVPRLTNWVLACDNLEAALALAPQGMGRPTAFSRGDLNWRMAVPDSGELPFDNVFPALIEWQGSPHPAPRLPDLGARLDRLTLRHPRAEELRAALAPLIDDARIEVEMGAPAISAQLLTPAGARLL